jgi:branched-chain amino acid transport system permease protein
MEYLTHLGILISIYSILGLSLNLVVGFTGLLSIAHGAFYGIGAYTTAILMTSLGVNFFVSVVAGIVISGIIALLVGIVLSRFDGDYFALTTLGFAVIMLAVFTNWDSLTRGPLGIPGIGRPELFGITLDSNLAFFVLAVIVLAVIYWLSRYITRSSFGRVIRAIREDEDALQVFGYKTSYYKLLIFVVGAAMAAVAGSLYASYISFVDPSAFALLESVFVLSIIIIGGLADHKGAILGAIILVLLPEALRFVGMPQSIAAQMRQLIYGLLLIVMMLYKPTGFLGKFRL